MAVYLYLNFFIYIEIRKSNIFDLAELYMCLDSSRH